MLVFILVCHAHLLFTGTMCMKLYCYDSNTVEASISWRHKLSLYGYNNFKKGHNFLFFFWIAEPHKTNVMHIYSSYIFSRCRPGIWTESGIQTFKLDIMKRTSFNDDHYILCTLVCTCYHVHPLYMVDFIHLDNFN